jgi:hypothetical protein
MSSHGGYGDPPYCVCWISLFQSAIRIPKLGTHPKGGSPKDKSEIGDPESKKRIRHR